MSTNFLFQKFKDNAQQCFAFTPQKFFQPIIRIFTEGEGDGIDSRLHFKKNSTVISPLPPPILVVYDLPRVKE